MPEMEKLYYRTKSYLANPRNNIS